MEIGITNSKHKFDFNWITIRFEKKYLPNNGVSIFAWTTLGKWTKTLTDPIENL